MLDEVRATGDRTTKFGLLTALYIAQGLPFGFFTSALPILMRQAGLSLTAIGALSLLNLPWALKFWWAPYVDHVGSRRTWLLALQMSSIALALVMSRTQIESGLLPVVIAAFLFSIIAATQDIATDGLAVRMLAAHERGPANAVQVGAYRIGMILGGGVLLFVFDKTNWETMFVCMALLLAATTFPVWFSRQQFVRSAAAIRPSLVHLAHGFFDRLRSPGVLAFIALVFCFRFGDAIVSSLLGPFIFDQKVPIGTIATMKNVAGSLASLAGAILGGWFTIRVGRRSALFISGIAQSLTFLPYWIASIGIGGLGLLWTATILEGLIGTMATVALFTLMMDASDPEHAGTDYTLFACAYVGVTFLGSLTAGRIADVMGYPTMFAIGIVLTVAGTLALVFALDRRPAPARVASVWTAAN